MTDERHPLSLRIRFLILTGFVAAAALVVATALLVRRRHVEAERLSETQWALDYAAPCARDFGNGQLNEGWSWKNTFIIDPSERYSAAYELAKRHEGLESLKDGWGNPLLIRRPGPVHRHGWDLYSFGPNGVDENGGGDDILVGEDVAPIVSRRL